MQWPEEWDQEYRDYVKFCMSFDFKPEDFMGFKGAEKDDEGVCEDGDGGGEVCEDESGGGSEDKDEGWMFDGLWCD